MSRCEVVERSLRGGVSGGFGEGWGSGGGDVRYLFRWAIVEVVLERQVGRRARVFVTALEGGEGEEAIVVGCWRRREDGGSNDEVHKRPRSERLGIGGFTGIRSPVNIQSFN